MQKLNRMNIIIQLKVQNLLNNINHCFKWTVISNAPKNAKTRKKFEASYIALRKPELRNKLTLKDWL